MGIVRRNSITITILTYVGMAIGFVNKILLFTNFLTEDQVGLINIFTSVAAAYAQFSALGINASVIKFFPFFQSHKKRGIDGLFTWSVLVISAGFILVTLLFLLLQRPVTEYYAAQSPLISQYYLLLIPLGLTTLFFNFFSNWLQALHKTVISSVAYEVILRLLVTAEISLFAFKLIDFGQFVAGYVLINFVPTLILLVYALTTRKISLKVRFEFRIRKLLKISGIYGLWQYLGGASTYITPVIGQLLVAGIKGLATGGIFTIMQYLGSFIIAPYRSIVKVSTPIVAGLWKVRSMQEMQKLYRNVSLVSLIIGGFLFLIVWVNLDNLFTLMPDTYRSGRYVFLFLGLGNIFEMYAGLNGAILVTSRKYRYDFAFSILLMVLTITTNLLLIPPMGMTGAALATMISSFVLNLFRIVAVWRFFRLQPFAWVDLLVVALVAALVGISALIPTIGNFISDAVVRTLLVSAAFCTAVYASRISPEANTMADKVLRRLRLKR